jgi:hypothetical protein
VAANTHSTSPVIGSTSIYPNFYFPLYANTPSASLFEPIFVEKLFAGADNGWDLPEAGKGELGAAKTDKNVSAFNMLGYADEDAADNSEISSEEDSETLLLTSLLSSGCYSTYGNLLGSIERGSTFTLLPDTEVNAKSSFNNELNMNAASGSYKMTQTIEPAADKVL